MGGAEYPAKVLGYDEDRDVAVLQLVYGDGEPVSPAAAAVEKRTAQSLSCSAWWAQTYTPTTGGHLDPSITSKAYTAPVQDSGLCSNWDGVPMVDTCTLTMSCTSCSCLLQTGPSRFASACLSHCIRQYICLAVRVT